MTVKTPSDYFPQLTDERLAVIAKSLLDIRFKTLEEMQSEFDDNYTREAAIFGRQRNMLIKLALYGKLPWLSLTHPGMDVTFSIEGVPFRFFTDNPDTPQKNGFFKRNDVDNLFVERADAPVIFRFVVDPALTDEDEDQALVLGYNIYQEKMCQWVYRNAAPTLHAVDNDVPPPVDLSPVQVDLKPEVPNSENEASTGK